MKAVRAPGLGGYSRSQLDELGRLAQSKGARGLLTMSLAADGYRGPLARNLSPEVAAAIGSRLECQAGDLLLLVADKSTHASELLGEMRLEIGRRLSLMPRDVAALLLGHRHARPRMERRATAVSGQAPPVHQPA